MDCRALTHDLLVEPLSREVQAHLGSCATCQARAAELQSLARALGQAAPPRVEDRALVRRVLGKLRMSPLPKPARKAALGRWVAAAAAAIGIALVFLLASNGPAPARLAGKAERPLTETPPPVAAPPAPREGPEPEGTPRTDRPSGIEPGIRPSPKAPEPTPKGPRDARPEESPPARAPTEPPAAPPAPSLRPAPSATEARPARVYRAIAVLEGPVEVSGKKAEKGSEWEKEGLLRAGDHPARVAFSDGTRLSLRPHAELILRGAETISLERGEIFCEVVPGMGRKFSVLTPDAAIQVTGTQFDVRRSDRTEVFVTAGEVRVSNDKGEVLLPAGTGSSVRKAAAPARPRPIDADFAVAWRRSLDPPEAARFRYDFEDSRKPGAWQSGRVVPGPARGLNKFCLEGSPNISLDLSRVEKKVLTARGAMKVRFRYFAPEGDSLTVQFFDERVKDNFRFELKPLAHQAWETFEAPLSEFYLLIDGAARIQEGDRLTWFNIAVSGTTGPFYFDDIELVEILR